MISMLFLIYMISLLHMIYIYMWYIWYTGPSRPIVPWSTPQVWFGQRSSVAVDLVAKQRQACGKRHWTPPCHGDFGPCRRAVTGCPTVVFSIFGHRSQCLNCWMTYVHMYHMFYRRSSLSSESIWEKTECFWMCMVQHWGNFQTQRERHNIETCLISE